MKAIEILKTIERYPYLAKYFGVSDNLDLKSMFDAVSLCGAYPQSQYVWFWCDKCPNLRPDFVLNVNGSKDKVYVYLVD